MNLPYNLSSIPPLHCSLGFRWTFAGCEIQAYVSAIFLGYIFEFQGVIVVVLFSTCVITFIHGQSSNILIISRVMCRLPTLILAECVLIYLEPTVSRQVVKWCAEKFETAAFVTYEQVVLAPVLFL